MNMHRHLCWSGMLLLIVSIQTGCDSAIPVVEVPPPTVSVSKPIVDNKFIDYDTYEGRIASIPMVEVRARVRGHLVKVTFQDGQMVKEGDLLFEIDPRTYQAHLELAKAKVQQAKADVEFRKNDLARNKEVAKTPGAISKQDLDLSESAVKVAEATLAAAKAAQDSAQLDVDYSKVTAPINGRISRSQVDVGNLVNAGGGETLLTTIVTVDPIYVYFDVDERSLLRYRRDFAKKRSTEQTTPAIKDLQIPIAVGLEGEQGFPHKGVIDFADNQVNPSTGTLQVRGRVGNPDGLLGVGMRARVQISMTEPRKALLVTERAVATDQSLRYVYVVNKDNKVERRDVKLGRTRDGLQVVTEGLKPDELVIVNGIQRVRDGMKVDPQIVPMPGAPGESTKQTTKS